MLRVRRLGALSVQTSAALGSPGAERANLRRLRAAAIAIAAGFLVAAILKNFADHEAAEALSDNGWDGVWHMENIGCAGLVSNRRREVINTFLARLAAAPFGFGRLDCCLALADWWQVSRGSDPALHLRGTYDDEASCERVLADGGGLLEVVRGVARRAGAERIDEPVPGCAAVVEWNGRQWGAIMTPTRRWAIKLGDGLCAVRACRVVEAWKV